MPPPIFPAVGPWSGIAQTIRMIATFTLDPRELRAMQHEGATSGANATTLELTAVPANRIRVYLSISGERDTTIAGRILALFARTPSGQRTAAIALTPFVDITASLPGPVVGGVILPPQWDVQLLMSGAATADGGALIMRAAFIDLEFPRPGAQERRFLRGKPSFLS